MFTKMTDLGRLSFPIQMCCWENTFRCFEFVEVIQSKQTRTEVDVQQLASGAHAPRTLRAINRDCKITELKTRFHKNVINLHL